MDKNVKIGVIGAGVFGGYHAGKCAGHARADFQGIYDLDTDAAAKVADQHGVTAFNTLGEMLEACEAVVIAAPASVHGKMGLTALQAGKHALIEKPLAIKVETAARMVDMADAQNLVLQVGHQERFVMRAIGVDRAPETPVRITARRHGPWSPRGTDVSVTMDLMTHDLDMAIWLMGEPPESVMATGEVLKSNHPDKVSARLQFASGAAAELSASRVAEGRDRVMRIEYPSGILEIDFVGKTFRNDTGFDFDPDFADHPRAKDSLGAGTDAFIASIVSGADVAVPGRAGLEAMKAAQQIDAAIEAAG